MNSLVLKSSALGVFVAIPGLLQAQTVNPAQMPPTMAASNSENEANRSPTVPGSAYVYDYFAATATVVNAGSPFNFTTSLPENTSGESYVVVVPDGPAGIAFLGDPNQFVPRVRKRISSFADTGVARATVAFAAGETNVMLSGYAPSRPNVRAEAGAAANLVYDPAVRFFTVSVSPDNSGAATVSFDLASSGASRPGGQ